MYVLFLFFGKDRKLYYKGRDGPSFSFTPDISEAQRYPTYDSVYDAYWELSKTFNLNVVVGLADPQ